MQETDSIQARREAQARRQAQSANVGGTSTVHNNLLFAGHLVPRPGYTAPAPAQPSNSYAVTHTEVERLSGASTPEVEEAQPKPRAAARRAQPVDYSSLTGVFIPAGIQLRNSPSEAEDTASTGPREAFESEHVAAVQRPFVAPPMRQQAQRITPSSGTMTSTDDEFGVAKMTKAQLATLAPRQSGLLPGYVLRERGGVMSNPSYRYFFEARELFVMASRRRGKKQSSNYVVSLDAQDLERDSESCFAKVRANFSGTEFVFYTASRDDRKELGAVLYEVNPGGIRGPRKMTVILPRLMSNGEMEEWRCTNDESGGLVQEYQTTPNSLRIVVLENKAPQWNEALKGYQLNFGGRIGMASVKNFQLVDVRDANQTVVMQFGKWSADRFNLDFRYPMNSTQAFCVALTSFDNKLLCE